MLSTPVWVTHPPDNEAECVLIGAHCSALTQTVTSQLHQEWRFSLTSKVTVVHTCRNYIFKTQCACSFQHNKVLYHHHTLVHTLANGTSKIEQLHPCFSSHLCSCVCVQLWFHPMAYIQWDHKAIFGVAQQFCLTCVGQRLSFCCTAWIKGGGCSSHLCHI